MNLAPQPQVHPRLGLCWTRALLTIKSSGFLDMCQSVLVNSLFPSVDRIGATMLLKEAILNADLTRLFMLIVHFLSQEKDYEVIQRNALLHTFQNNRL